MAVKEFNIGSKLVEGAVKVTVNEYGDSIIVNASDAGFVKRFGDFLKWLEDKELEIAGKQKELEEKYGDGDFASEDEDGNVIINTDALVDFAKVWSELYESAAVKIDQIFGQGCLKKYFRAFYEMNQEFIPDEECIVDFLEEISPIIGYAYTARQKRITSKYSKNRKGRKK